MEIGDNKWEALLDTGAATYGLSLTSDEISALSTYAQTLVQWNKTVNLTAITDPEGVAIKHLVDSLAIIPFIPDGAAVVDIGSGGGLPGIPLGIMRPDVSVVMVDSVRKKTSFIGHAARLLKLPGCISVHTRIERLDIHKYTSSGFDIAMSRAFSDVTQMVSVAAPLIHQKGRIITMKSQQVDQDISTFMTKIPESFQNHGGWIQSCHYDLPVISHPRAIVSVGYGSLPEVPADLPSVFSADPGQEIS